MTCEAQILSASSYLLRTDVEEAAAAGQLSAAASGSGKDCSREEGRRGDCHCIQGVLYHFSFLQAITTNYAANQLYSTTPISINDAKRGMILVSPSQNSHLQRYKEKGDTDKDYQHMTL